MKVECLQGSSIYDHYFILQLSSKLAALVTPIESLLFWSSAECYFFAGGLGPFVFGIESEVVTKEEAHSAWTIKVPESRFHQF